MALVNSLPIAKNRHPVAADCTGIARKQLATALTAAQCGYAHTQVYPGNGQTPQFALSGLC